MGCGELPPQALGVSAAATVRTSKHAGERGVMKPSSMNEEPFLWHITGVRSLLAVAMLALAAPFVACSKPEPLACPDDLPASCPMPAPTFSADVAPLIQKYCAVCHSPGGAQPNPLLTSYDTIAGSINTARDVETQLHACKMPPSDEPQPTSDERQTILGWFVCGAKND